MTKKAHREAIKAAAELIAAELEAGRDVRIPGFGLFYVRDQRVALNMDQRSRKQTHVQGVVRFRPFSRLKAAVRNLQPRCPAQQSWLPGDVDQCIHRDDHATMHTDERGRTWS